MDSTYLWGQQRVTGILRRLDSRTGALIPSAKQSARYHSCDSGWSARGHDAGQEPGPTTVTYPGKNCLLAAAFGTGVRLQPLLNNASTSCCARWDVAVGGSHRITVGAARCSGERRFFANQGVSITFPSEAPECLFSVLVRGGRGTIVPGGDNHLFGRFSQAGRL